MVGGRKFILLNKDDAFWVVLFATLAMTQLLKWNAFVVLAAVGCLGLLLKWSL